MKVPVRVEQHYRCNQCNNKIDEKRGWFRFKHNDAMDFCSQTCIEKYRDNIYAVITVYRDVDEPRLIGNTD